MESLDLRKKENNYVVNVGSLKYPVYFMHFRDYYYVVDELEGQEPKARQVPHICGGATVAYVRFVNEVDLKKPIYEDLRGKDKKYGGLFFDDRLNIIGAYAVTYCHTEETYKNAEGRKYALERLKQVLSIRKIVF
jgi:hypothetical protein